MIRIKNQNYNIFFIYLFNNFEIFKLKMFQIIINNIVKSNK